MGIESKISGDGKTLTIKITERFDFSMQQEFRGAYKESSDTISDIILDLSQADYMDSSALGMLLLLKQFADEKKAKIYLKNPSESVAKILQMANFDKLFTIQ